MSSQCSDVSKNPELARRIVGMDLTEREEGRQGSDCCQKEEFKLSDSFSQKHKIGTCCSWKYPVSVDVLATHMRW